MRYQDHCKECEEKLGKRWECVHWWLDEFAKKYNDPFFKHMHWLHRHHIAGIEEVRHKWGDQAAEAAKLHIMSDFGLILSMEELEKFLKVY